MKQILTILAILFCFNLYAQKEKLYTDEWLRGKSSMELRIFRNEIFARHGYIFKSKDLNEHFSEKSWYEPKYDNVDKLLTDIDKKNIAFIKKQEDYFKELTTNKDKIFQQRGDSIKVPTFTIELQLSKNAEKLLTEKNESIIVQAYFRGMPIDKTVEEYIDFGEFHVGKYRIELIENRIAVFDNVWIHKELFDKLEDPNFEILINVFTGRRSSSYNLVTGDLLQDLVYIVMDKTHKLNIKLIEE